MPSKSLQSQLIVSLLLPLNFAIVGCAQQDFPRSKPPPVATAPVAPGRVPPTQALDDSPSSTTLVSTELETQFLEGFKKFYVSRAASPPKAYFSIKAEIPENSVLIGGQKRITEAELQPYLTRPLRRAGVLVYDTVSDQTTVTIEAVLSVRNVPYYAPEGNSTNEIPDIRLLARRNADRAIIGQSSTFELLGTKKAWSVFRRIGERELLRATVLSLLEDMIINASEASGFADVKSFKEFQGYMSKALTRAEVLENASTPPVKPSPNSSRRTLALTREDYLQKPDQPLRPLIKESLQELAQRSLAEPVQ